MELRLRYLNRYSLEKTPSFGYKNPHFKPKTADDRLRFIMGILIPIRRWFLGEQKPRSMCSQAKMFITRPITTQYSATMRNAGYRYDYELTTLHTSPSLVSYWVSFRIIMEKMALLWRISPLFPSKALFFNAYELTTLHTSPSLVSYWVSFRIIMEKMALLWRISPLFPSKALFFNALSPDFSAIVRLTHSVCAAFLIGVSPPWHIQSNNWILEKCTWHHL